MEKAIVVKDVSKKYKLYDNARERLFDLFRPGKYGEAFLALSNVNFVAEPGEVVGFIGTNGSGKSTLSNIIAGIVPESSGSVKVNGDVSLIAVAAGLRNDLSGRDNIELKLLMLGFNKEEIKALEPVIIEFAELEDFIDQPVKSYSSGMKSRLGFAISVSVDPEILIIDEALSVGDRAFAEKSLNKMKEFKAMGKTMIFVSHSLGQMKKFCDKILWLEYGKVKEYGTVEEVIPKYEEFLEVWKRFSKKEREEYKTNVLNNNIQNAVALVENKKRVENQNNKIYKEKPISRLGRFNNNLSFIYESPKELKKGTPTKKYKNYVYFIKKRVEFNDKSYFLISTEPSAQRGVIGWVQEEDIRTRVHTLIDEDSKSFIIKGTGRGYDRPWGGKYNCVFNDLSKYSNNSFDVVRTERVGRTIWYYGILDSQKVWIKQKDLEEVE